LPCFITEWHEFGFCSHPSPTHCAIYDSKGSSLDLPNVTYNSAHRRMSEHNRDTNDCFHSESLKI
jgi:hypothetical protein